MASLRLRSSWVMGRRCRHPYRAGWVILGSVFLAILAAAPTSGPGGPADRHVAAHEPAQTNPIRTTSAGGCAGANGCSTHPEPPSIARELGAAPFLLNHSLAWSQVAVPPSGIGVGGGMIANSSSGVAVEFGGTNSGSLVNSTFAYSESTNGWSALSPSRAPSPRSDFSFAFDPGLGNAVLFGGLTNLSTLSVSNETWTYDFGASRWTLATHGAAPAAREGAAFAIVPALGVGILYGGWDRNFSRAGSLTYSDLWELNLSTTTWSNLSVPGPRPPPLAGAAMVWDPLTARLDMFGGCYPCSAEVWQFDPVSLRWTAPTLPASSPAPRAAATWAFDPTLGADLLFGGTDGNTTFNDTQVFYPRNDTWVSQTLTPVPKARSYAAAAFLNVTSNQTLLLEGGQSGATYYSDFWRLSATSNLSLRVVNASSLAVLSGAQVNLSGRRAGASDSDGYLNLTQVDGVNNLLQVTDDPWFYSSNTTVWLAPGQPASLTVELLPEPLGSVFVQVLSSTGPSLPGAYLNLTVDSVRINSVPSVSNTVGNASFYGVPPGRANVTGQASGWRPAYVRGVLSPGGHFSTTLEMYPDPVLTVQVLGRLPGGPVPLIAAEVYLNGTPFGLTDSSGFVTNTTSDLGLVPIAANATGFVTAFGSVSIPFTGSTNTTLVLPTRPYGIFAVTVRDQNAGFPIAGATVITFTPKPLKFGPFSTHNETDNFGIAGFSLPVGNYTVTAEATNYLLTRVTNISVVSGVNLPLTIFLFPVPPATVHFIVHDQRDGNPIAKANVTCPLVPAGVTNSAGLYNVTNLAPGFYRFAVSAPGYFPNVTALPLFSTENLTLVVNLTPAFFPVIVRSVWGFNLFPGGLAEVWPFVLLPVLLVLGSFLLLSVLRGSREEETSGNSTVEFAAGDGDDAPTQPLSRPGR